jgi:hypothetical protein
MHTLSSQPPWVALTVAIIALLGVSVTAVVTYWIARSTRRAEAARAKERLDHEKELKNRDEALANGLQTQREDFELKITTQNRSQCLFGESPPVGLVLAPDGGWPHAGNLGEGHHEFGPGTPSPMRVSDSRIWPSGGR